MTRWALGTAVATLAVLAASTAAATGMDIRLDGTAPQINAVEGHAAGQIIAFFQEDQIDSPKVAPAGFILEAARLRVETDSADISVHATGTPKKVNPTTTPQDYTDATVTGTVNRAGFRLNVAAMEDGIAMVDAACDTASSSPSDAVTRVPFVNLQRADLQRNTATGVKWSACTGIRIHGDIQISQWEWDAVLHADGQQTMLETGSRPSPLLPADAPNTAGIVGRDVEVYLIARNATLTIPSLGNSYLLLTGAETQLAAVTLEIPRADGNLDIAGERRQLRDHALTITTPPLVIMSGRGAQQPMGIVLDGQAGGIALDGETLSASVSPLASYGGTTFILAGLVLVAVAAVYARPTAYYHWRRWRGEPTGYTPAKSFKERRGAGYWALATRAMKRARLPRAGRLNARSVRVFPSSLDARLQQGMIARARGHYEAALVIFAELRELMPVGREKATVACMCAEAAVHLARLPDALAWLRQAARDHFPTFKAELGNATFDHLADDDWFVTMRELDLPITARSPPKGDAAFN